MEKRALPFVIGVNGPFTVASALAAGTNAGRLRRRDLESPFRGVRRPRSAPTDPADDDGRPTWAAQATARDRAEQARRRRLLSEARAFALLLRPNEVFCGVTAAELWDAPLPRSFRSDVLHVGVRRPGRGRRTSGTVGHTIARDADISHRRLGLPVTDAASTWIALAAVLPLDELVALGDHLVHTPVIPDRTEPDRPFVSLEILTARAASHRGRGATRAHTAIGLLVTGSESRPESLLRLLLQRAGLPEPEVNGTIHDARGRIGRFDLVYRPWKVVAEYDGDQHRTDDEQYERDMTRVERATHAGWSVVRVRKRGLFREPRATVRRVQAALRRAGWPGSRDAPERTQDAAAAAR